MNTLLKWIVVRKTMIQKDVHGQQKQCTHIYIMILYWLYIIICTDDCILKNCSRYVKMIEELENLI